MDVFISNLWRWKSGMTEVDATAKKVYPTLEQVRKENWSHKFEMYMRNRLTFGYFRYGPLSKQKKGEYDNIGSIEKRLEIYKETGNDEILVDVANLAMVEFMNGAHPKKHFKSEDDGIHTQKRSR